jgi:PAS domain S-box-containing protein
MSRLHIQPTGTERLFDADEIIVSKTDLTGKITYANDVFLRVSGYERADILGAPHSILRHPDMPRCIFHLMWEMIQGGREIFAYVVNLASNGDHYWVYAHVTPTLDGTGRITGYHSNRRTPDRRALTSITSLYAELRAQEAGHATKREAIRASSTLLSSRLASLNRSYDEFVWSL